MYSIILGKTFSPTVWTTYSQCWHNTKPFSNINSKYDQGAQMHTSVAPRCINCILGIQYHTTYQTVSTLRYEVLELLKLLLQIVTRESDQHIWLVATSLTFSQYNDSFYCTLVFVADPHWRPMKFPPAKGGASVTLTASQNCSSTTNPKSGPELQTKKSQQPKL